MLYRAKIYRFTKQNGVVSYPIVGSSVRRIALWTTPPFDAYPPYCLEIYHDEQEEVVEEERSRE